MKSLGLTHEQMLERRRELYRLGDGATRRKLRDAKPENREKHRNEEREKYQTIPSYRENQKAYRRRPEVKARKIGCDVPCRPMPDQCELCAAPRGPRSLHIDHCHLTKKFRGWLCSPCNLLLGLAKDNPDFLRAAANFLELHK